MDGIVLAVEYIMAVFLYCCSDCPAHLKSIGQATWAAIKKRIKNGHCASEIIIYLPVSCIICHIRPVVRHTFCLHPLQHNLMSSHLIEYDHQGEDAGETSKTDDDHMENNKSHGSRAST